MNTQDVNLLALGINPTSVPALPKKDRETILNHEFDLGYGKVLSVRDIESQYKLSEIDTFLDS